MDKLTKQQLNRLAKKYKINTLYLFGSQASGKAIARSDYDFAVLFDDKVPEKRFDEYQVKIISDLLRLIDTEHIDLIVLNSSKIPLLLRFNIVQEGKILFEKNKAQRVYTEVCIRRRWFDWEYFEDLYNKIRAEKRAEVQSTPIWN